MSQTVNMLGSETNLEMDGLGDGCGTGGVVGGGARLTNNQGGNADSESTKQRKKFSKRHSKNGLTAVF